MNTTMDTTTIENAFEIGESEQGAPDQVALEFHITTDRAAEWMLRILANNSAEKVRIAAQAQEMIAVLVADSERLMYRHGAELEEYCRQKLAADGNRRRSVRFLQGTCAFRHQGAAVRVKDATAALLWCREHRPALVAVESVEKLDADGFRDAAERIRTETGEMLPGVEFSEGGDAFSLSFPTAVKPEKTKR